MKSGDAVSSNQSSDKLLKLLEFLSTQGDPLRLIDIAKALDMNSSTVLRFLTTLINNDYVAQEPETSKYYLTYKLCALGQQIKSHKQLSTTTAPYLQELAKTVGETCCLAINQNNQVVYIDVVESPGQIVKAMQRIGNIAPLHCTGIGKLLLTNYTEEQIDTLVNHVGLAKYTEKTLTTKEALLKELEEVKAKGYAYDNEECEIGTRCISFPIYDYSDKVIAGFSVTGPSIRLNDEFFDQWIPTLHALSLKLSHLFGYQNLSCRN